MTKKGVIPEWFYEGPKLFKGKNTWMPDKSAQAWWEKEGEGESTPIVSKTQKDKKKKIKNNPEKKHSDLRKDAPV